MKLALYLPNFRDHVTIQELEDLTACAEDLDFDSVWTLDRIIVPETSDHEQLTCSFGMMTDLPKSLPVIDQHTASVLGSSTSAPDTIGSSEPSRVSKVEAAPTSSINAPDTGPSMLFASSATAGDGAAPAAPKRGMMVGVGPRIEF